MLREIWTAFWKIGAFMLLWAVLYAPLLVPFVRLGQLYAELTGTVTILVAAWIMRARLGFHRQHMIRDLACGFVLGTSMMTLCVAFMLAAGFARFQSPSVVSATLAVSALAMIANSVTQEVLFRGYVQKTLETQFGSAASVVLSSMFFAILHVGALKSLLPAINLFLAGLLLGLAYAVTRNLWLPIGIHLGWNFLQGPLLGLVVSGNDTWAARPTVVLRGPEIMTGGRFGIEGGLAASVVTLVAIAAIYSVRQIAPAAPDKVT